MLLFRRLFFVYGKSSCHFCDCFYGKLQIMSTVALLLLLLMNSAMACVKILL